MSAPEIIERHCRSRYARVSPDPRGAAAAAFHKRHRSILGEDAVLSSPLSRINRATKRQVYAGTVARVRGTDAATFHQRSKTAIKQPKQLWPSSSRAR